jgi:hypothetical protein
MYRTHPTSNSPSLWFSFIQKPTGHHKVPLKTLELIGMKAKEYIKRTQKTQLPGVSLSN